MGKIQCVWSHVLQEFLGMTLFVFIGCGTAKVSTDTNAIAMAFGMAIMVLVYALFHTSGGQLNWAVTVGLVTAGCLEPVQAAANLLAQLLGGILGATLLVACLPEDVRGDLGSNAIRDGYSYGNAFVAELIFSFMLVFVIFKTAVDKDAVTGSDDDARPIAAPIAIGFTVYLAHLFLIPITGCSINPPRSFGPALVATIDGQKNLFDDFHLFFFAPLVGGILAGLLQRAPSYFEKKHEVDDGPVVEATAVGV